MKHAAAALAIAVFCLGAGNQERKSRPFGMGVNPFPSDLTPEAIESMQLFILDHTDLVSIKLDEGVPWQEALENKSSYDPNFEGSLDWKSKFPRDKRVFLSTTPLNKEKSGMALYRGSGENMPNPEPWNKKDLDDPMVAKAYLNYCKELIRRYKPDFFAYGIEVNNLVKVPAKWKLFVPFVRDLYVALKKENPRLPLILTLSTETATDEAQAATQKKAIKEILPYTDLVAVTALPYIFQQNPAKLPKDYFSQMAALAPQKPFAIAETAFLAEDANFLGIERVGKAAWQADYLKFCFDEGVKYNAKFIVWMIPRDLDDLYEKLPPLIREILVPIRDTGLLDGKGNPRKSFELWSQWLKIPRK